MNHDEKRARIEALTAESNRLYASAYAVEAEIDRLHGDALAAEYHDALAAHWRQEPGAKERKDRAYIRLQASRVVTYPAILDGIEESDRAAVRAEVDRILAEREAAADADLLADRPSHETAVPEVDGQ